MKLWIFAALITLNDLAYSVLAGGRPNTFSGGNNAFAGTVNPANAVWVGDRFDIGGYLVQQKFTLNNRGNPGFPQGKTDFTHRVRNLLTCDFAIQKHFEINISAKKLDSALTFAVYTLPSFVKTRTKHAIPAFGTTPVYVSSRTDAISVIYSIKLDSSFSVGFGVDYFQFSHRRDGYQNAANPLRSVSPENVTNNGTDHSSGLGIIAGVRWNITKRWHFGAAWARKTYCGQFKRYRGFEPHHAENFTPQTVGGGFTYIFTEKLAGRVEMIWSQFGNLPSANNSVFPNGSLNTNKRGSRNSPGPGLQDATFINLGLGYKIHPKVALGGGWSHRIKLKSSTFISHSYRLRTTYDILAFGGHMQQGNLELFLVATYGFKNKRSGSLPNGGKVTTVKQLSSFSISLGRIF